jgi:hypothetical protein
MDEQTLLVAGGFVLLTLLCLPLVAAVFGRSTDGEDESE